MAKCTYLEQSLTSMNTFQLAKSMNETVMPKGTLDNVSLIASYCSTVTTLFGQKSFKNKLSIIPVEIALLSCQLFW